MKALITAGGKGTRMRPLTFATNKHFISLANKPLLFYAIEEVAAAGIKEIGINYNPGQLEEIQSYLGDGCRWGVKFTFILQEKPIGLANIVQVSKDFLGGDRFVMHLGDNIFFGGIGDLVKKFSSAKANGLLAMIHHPENRRLGVPYFDKEGKVVQLVEKPENPPHDWAIPGLYFADQHIFDCFKGEEAIKPSARGEYEIPSAFQWLIDHRYQVEMLEFKGTWLDPGKFDDWIETNRFLLDHALSDGVESDLPETVKIQGKVKIGKNCRIDHAILRGPAIIGDNVVITDSFIGEHSSINDGCQIISSQVQNSILEKEVKISSLNRLVEGSLIGAGTLVEGGQKVELFVGNQCSLRL